MHKTPAQRLAEKRGTEWPKCYAGANDGGPEAKPAKTVKDDEQEVKKDLRAPDGVLDPKAGEKASGVADVAGNVASGIGNVAGGLAKTVLNTPLSTSPKPVPNTIGAGLGVKTAGGAYEEPTGKMTPWGTPELRVVPATGKATPAQLAAAQVAPQADVTPAKTAAQRLCEKRSASMPSALLARVTGNTKAVRQHAMDNAATRLAHVRQRAADAHNAAMANMAATNTPLDAFGRMMRSGERHERFNQRAQQLVQDATSNEQVAKQIRDARLMVGGGALATAGLAGIYGLGKTAGIGGRIANFGRNLTGKNLRDAREAASAHVRSGKGLKSYKPGTPADGVQRARAAEDLAHKANTRNGGGLAGKNDIRNEGAKAVDEQVTKAKRDTATTRALTGGTLAAGAAGVALTAKDKKEKRAAAPGLIRRVANRAHDALMPGRAKALAHTDARMANHLMDTRAKGTGHHAVGFLKKAPNDYVMLSRTAPGKGIRVPLTHDQMPASIRQRMIMDNTDKVKTNLGGISRLAARDAARANTNRANAILYPAGALAAGGLGYAAFGGSEPKTAAQRLYEKQAGIAGKFLGQSLKGGAGAYGPRGQAAARGYVAKNAPAPAPVAPASNMTPAPASPVQQPTKVAITHAAPMTAGELGLPGPKDGVVIGNPTGTNPGRAALTRLALEYNRRQGTQRPEQPAKTAAQRLRAQKEAGVLGSVQGLARGAASTLAKGNKAVSKLSPMRALRGVGVGLQRSGRAQGGFVGGVKNVAGKAVSAGAKNPLAAGGLVAGGLAGGYAMGVSQPGVDQPAQ